MQSVNKTKQFIRKFPLLLPTLEKFKENNIEYAIGGSGCLFLLGNDRFPDDVDIFIQDEDHDRVDKLFNMESFEYKSATESVRNSNPEGDHSIQITSHLKITIAGKEYDLRIKDETLNQRIIIKEGECTLKLLPPEDVMIIKAILQRGKEVGKKDLEDIENFKKIYTLEENYLNERIKTIGAEERVGNILNNNANF